MKNPRAVIMIVVSVAIGLAAVVLASRWLAEQAAVASSKVVVAAVDIELGSRLNSQMLKPVEWPSGSLPAGAYTDSAKLLDRVVKTSVLRGEPILESKLAPVGTKGGLSAVITEGKRAITVRVNDVIGVAGFALPGNFVDILVSTDEGDKKISKIVLEKILVLAVAQEAGRDETKPKVVNAVTLEVTPLEAEKLDLARSVGSLSLVLRNQVDQTPTQTSGVTKNELLSGAKAVPAPAVSAIKPAEPAPVVAKKPVSRRVTVAQAQRNCVEVIKGTTRSRECF